MTRGFRAGAAARASLNAPLPRVTGARFSAARLFGTMSTVMDIPVRRPKSTNHRSGSDLVSVRGTGETGCRPRRATLTVPRRVRWTVLTEISPARLGHATPGENQRHGPAPVSRARTYAGTLQLSCLGSSALWCFD